MSKWKPYILPKSKRELILWIVLLPLLFGAFFAFDYLDSDYFYRFDWAPWASISLIGFFLYVKGIYLIHNHAEHNGRNVVRWTTASIAFSPFLAGLIYLLTWPEKRRSTAMKRHPGGTGTK